MTMPGLASRTDVGRVRRTARGLLVALHAAFVVLVGVYALAGIDGWPARLAAIALVTIAVGLSLHHCWAVAHGARPYTWPLTFAALALVVALALYWYGWAVFSVLSLPLASALVLVGGRAMLIATTAVSALAGVAAYQSGLDYDGTIGESIVGGWVFGVSAAVVAGSLWAATLLVRRLDELHATRAALAEFAVDRERERVSRDLHDLLGQSLTAVSLKGDLAVRLLDRDPAAARREVESLTGMARDALRDARAIARGDHFVSLDREVSAAAELLEAAAITARVEVDVPPLGAAARDALAWAVREGTTNVLRHSDAVTCTIRLWTDSGGPIRTVHLRIENDGMRGPHSPAVRDSTNPTGLAGLSSRVAELGGTVKGTATAGRFRLDACVPAP